LNLTQKLRTTFLKLVSPTYNSSSSPKFHETPPVHPGLDVLLQHHNVSREHPVSLLLQEQVVSVL